MTPCAASTWTPCKGVLEGAAPSSWNIDVECGSSGASGALAAGLRLDFAQRGGATRLDRHGVHRVRRKLVLPVPTRHSSDADAAGGSPPRVLAWRVVHGV